MSTYISSKVARWYVIYTRSRTEKKVLERLLKKNIEVYIPFQKKLKQWSDRMKWVEEPVIRCYAFVKITMPDYFEVLNTPGVVRFLFFLRKPACIPEKQLKMLKNMASGKINVEATLEKLEPGQLVKIIRGPLKGNMGELIRYHGKNKVVLKIDHLAESFLVEINNESLEKIIPEP